MLFIFLRQSNNDNYIWPYAIYMYITTYMYMKQWWQDCTHTGTTFLQSRQWQGITSEMTGLCWTSFLKEPGDSVFCRCKSTCQQQGKCPYKSAGILCSRPCTCESMWKPCKDKVSHVLNFMWCRFMNLSCRSLLQLSNGWADHESPANVQGSLE